MGIAVEKAGETRKNFRHSVPDLIVQRCIVVRESTAETNVMDRVQ